jgi:hypothetical protein
MLNKILAAVAWIFGLVWEFLKVPVIGMYKIAIGILLFVLIVALFMAWCFVAYQIAWWVADETSSRVCLLVFLVGGMIVGFVSKAGPLAWMNASQSAQAEYLADLLKKQGDKSD